MLSLSVVIATAFSTFGLYGPNPLDKGGLGLRVHNFSVRGPYINELIDNIRFSITLINFSPMTRSHDLLDVAQQRGALRLFIGRPDGSELPQQHGYRYIPRDKVPQTQLRPGTLRSQEFNFAQCGYHYTLGGPGRYRMMAVLTLDGVTITSPPVELEVVAVSKESVLASYTVPLEGIASTRPPHEQSHPVVQQVKVGSTTLLFYERRLAELPGKVEMKVEGAYGSNNPLMITYVDPKSPTGTTKLVINSIDGMPWTEEEERLRRKRAEARTAPAPRLLKP